MASLEIDKFRITEDSPTFCIAEIGQNHQGDIDIAKQLIKVAKEHGADCVKFQKTDIYEKFNNKALERIYDNCNSWGKTYKEHKEYLEFSKTEFMELQTYANDLGILFTASAMDSASLKFLISIGVPFIKIGSGDANNFFLIEEAAKANIPLVISTGMQEFETVKKIYQIVSDHHKNFALLHCISSYPTPIEDLNLKVINLYKEEFPDIIIGYSGHEFGNDISITAVALGAKIIERHLTLTKNQKGSDHKCSLLPTEFTEMVTKIRTVEIALGKPIKKRQNSEISCYEKLGKTIVASKNLKKDHKLTLEDLKIKVAEPKGIDGIHIYSVVEKSLLKDLKVDQSITIDCVNE